MPIHHPLLIRELPSTARVLEIGPGSSPFARADVLCDRYSRDSLDSFKQDGEVDRPTYPQPVIIYPTVRLPFTDKAFDYVVCSHVLEHVCAEELREFVSELMRVAKSGYLEFPSFFLELIHNVGVHRWIMNVVDGEIRLMNKANLEECAPPIAKALSPVFKQFWLESPGFQQHYREYLPLWIIGLEWEQDIKIRIVHSIDDLIDHSSQKRLISSLAVSECAARPLSKQLAHAFLNRFKRVRRKSPVKTRREETKESLPDWLGTVTVCCVCSQAGVRFYPDRANCSSCGKEYRAANGEYLFAC